MARKPGNRVNLLGLTYGRLTVVGAAPDDRWRAARWVCRCVCGNTTTVVGSRLICGRTVSCGCYGKERRAAGRWPDKPDPPPAPKPDFNDPLLKPWS